MAFIGLQPYNGKVGHITITIIFSGTLLVVSRAGRRLTMMTLEDFGSEDPGLATELTGPW